MVPKGLILAGGKGNRLYPLTVANNKHLLPIYDKPVIYYALATLLEAGIKDICIITPEKDRILFQNLLKNGKHLGINLHYESQKHPNGTAEAFIIAETFIGKDSIIFILGDNFFHGENLGEEIKRDYQTNHGATIYGYYTTTPSEYGVAQMDKNNNIIKIIEKPSIAPSNYAITGLYIYSNDVINIAKKITPSKRKELEVSDINKVYLNKKKLKFKILDNSYMWIDTGTPQNLFLANQYVTTFEQKKNKKIGCLEEIAYKKNYINQSQLNKLIQPIKTSPYGQYLLKINT